MTATFSAYDYARHLGARWRLLAALCGLALTAALAFSLLLPKRFTATARILIESPAGNDPRASTAVSPIYLESLRTYEHFASSDSLFAAALDRFRLRENNRAKSLEAWKREVLNVALARSTKILEISVTLHDPAAAHGLALYLAEETVKLSRAVNRDSDQDLIADLEGQAAGAKARMDAAEAERSRLASSEPTARLESEISAAEEARTGVVEELLPAEMALAEAPDAQWARQRAAMLGQRRDQLDAEIARKQQLLAAWKIRAEDAGAHLAAARAAFQAADTRLREVRGGVGFRGERLNIVDRGVPPERPSFPNLPLNLLAALLVALAGWLLAVSIEFGWRLEGKASDAAP